MISLTYLKLVITKADRLRISEWITFFKDKVLPALEAADENGDGQLSLREIVALIKRLLFAAL